MRKQKRGNTTYLRHSDNTYAHRRIVSAALGRPLKRGEVVHHHDGDGTRNRGDNLVICTQGYHMLIHARQRALAACGNPSWRPCVICKAYDDIANMRYNQRAYRHPACSREYQADLNDRLRLEGRFPGRTRAQRRELDAAILTELRGGATQVQTAKRLGVSQAKVSKVWVLSRRAA